MYRINEASGKLLGVWTDGQLSAEDLDGLAADLEARIARHGRLRLLFRAGNFCAWNAAAFSSMLRFSRRHEAHVERAAIIGARGWEACMRELLVCLTGIEARYFLPSDLGRAWAWLQRDESESDPEQDMEATTTMTVSKGAERPGGNPRRVRYDERRELIPDPSRTATGGPPYDPGRAARARPVKRAQEQGFTLEEVKELLALGGAPGATKGEIKRLAEAKLADLDAKIRELSWRKQALEELVETCSGRGPTSACPIVLAFEAPVDSGRTHARSAGKSPHERIDHMRGSYEVQE